MTEQSPLRIRYGEHARVRRLQAILRYHLEEIALGFERWDETRVYGPGAYLAVVVGPSIETYADPMGDNRWPDGVTRIPMDDPEEFASGLTEVAYTRDGALVVSVDGMVCKQLVRFRSIDEPTDLEYASWMGSRHMSALDVSTRPDVVATLTLSQESGRVTTFEDGTFESVRRENLGGRWRVE